MTTERIYKLYPSSSGFALEDGYVVEYNSACLRYLPAAMDADRIEIDPKYMTLGLQHEDMHAERLGDKLKDRELPVKREYQSNVVYSGRVDFITTDGEIHETKGSMSKNFLYSVIRKKQPKLSHVAQLTSYLAHLNMTKGKIVAGYYVADKKGKVGLKEEVIFDVEVDENGDLFIDGNKYKYSLKDQLKYLEMAVETVSSGLPRKKRPSNYMDFSGPCTYCPLKYLCTMYDKDKVSSEVFKKEAIDLINHVAQQSKEKFK